MRSVCTVEIIQLMANIHRRKKNGKGPKKKSCSRLQETFGREIIAIFRNHSSILQSRNARHPLLIIPICYPHVFLFPSCCRLHFHFFIVQDWTKSPRARNLFE